ncbi:MAG: MarR family winged helix-turn-helix transcriptional regulator [Atopobiaceae bacterium]
MDEDQKGKKDSLDVEEPDVRQMDIMYHATDRLYSELARGCGLSDSAYWILYDIVVAGGTTAVRDLSQTYSMSKQTVNSSLRSLVRKGLVRLEFCAGSRKNKAVILTDEGRKFCDQRLVPAMQAEQRAFQTLSLEDRRTLVRLIGQYSEAVGAQLDVMRAQGGSN